MRLVLHHINTNLGMYKTYYLVRIFLENMYLIKEAA